MQQQNEIPDLQNFIKEVRMGPTQRFRNNGPWTQKQDYEFKTKVEERFKLAFPSSFNQISSASIDIGVEIPGKKYKVMSSEWQFLQLFLSVFYKPLNTTGTKGFEKSYNSDFKVAKQITVPPCTEYNITASVGIAENVVFNYRIEFQLTGILESGLRMSSKQIRSFAKDLTFLRDLDDCTVIAEASAEIEVTFGQETVIDASGLVSDECINLEKHCTCKNDLKSKN